MAQSGRAQWRRKALNVVGGGYGAGRGSGSGSGGHRTWLWLRLRLLGREGGHRK